MSRALLITRTDLLSITNIGGNVDDDKYLQDIISIQDSDLLFFIGQDLLDKVEDGVINQNIAEPYYTLYSRYIKYYLAFATASRYVLMANYTIGNGGVSFNSAGNSVGMSDIQDMSYQIDIDKNMYAQRMIDYLKDNKASFPEYQVSKGTGTFMGWELGGSNTCE